MNKPTRHPRTALQAIQQGATIEGMNPVQLTVDDLIALLGKMPADANVCLATKYGGEAESFAVEYDDDTGWVTLAG
jgi:hypothetical protein